jgi:hypothetical protein
VHAKERPDNVLIEKSMDQKWKSERAQRANSRGKIVHLRGTVRWRSRGRGGKAGAYEKGNLRPLELRVARHSWKYVRNLMDL